MRSRFPRSPWSLLAILCLLGVPARAQETVHLRILGGLANVSQYVRFEQPFWERRIRELSGGRLTAEIMSFDAAGLRPSEVLPLMRLGVAPFANVLLAAAAGEDPEINIADLPTLNPDIASLRQNVARVRPFVAQLLRDRYDVELLAIYTYPAQVIFCRRAFSGLSDLAGRRVRTSSVAQSEVVEALGARPVVIPFAEIVPAIRAGVVECAITGTLSGNAIGLHEVTTHVHALAISWGLSAFGASRGAWETLSEADRALLRSALADLEREIWEGAERETGEGLACNTGQSGCSSGRPGRMTLVPVSRADAALRERLLRETVLPRWIARCGPDCAQLWNDLLAPLTGVRARAS
ncbi:MAG: TRAP transporter substrate-binding protein [Roseococcus sp.]|nr:TRAP transporter substrate-binding protein [Roseococcus sp.]